MTMLDVIEKPKVTTTNDGDHDRYAHYFKKADIDAAWLEGKTVTALCGKKDKPTRPVEGRNVCPTCKERLNDLPG